MSCLYLSMYNNDICSLVLQEQKKEYNLCGVILPGKMKEWNTVYASWPLALQPSPSPIRILKTSLAKPLCERKEYGVKTRDTGFRGSA